MTKTRFEPTYTAVTKDGAEWIVAHPNIRLVGIDYLSIAHYADLIGPHIVLLSEVRIYFCDILCWRVQFSFPFGFSLVVVQIVLSYESTGRVPDELSKPFAHVKLHPAPSLSLLKGPARWLFCMCTACALEHRLRLASFNRDR